jgi:hypothetical protein
MNLFKLFLSKQAREREEVERVLALADVNEHPIFKAVLSYADEHARNEHEMTLGANLTDAQRHFNAGRSASAYDFALALRQIQANATARAQKLRHSD